MNTDSANRRSNVRTTGMSSRASEQEGISRTLLVFGLCALLPPAGLLILWRSRHTTLAMRIGASLLAVCAMTLFFGMRMENGQGGSILPSPVVPTTVGYGSVQVSSHASGGAAPAPAANAAPGAAAPAPVQSEPQQTENLPPPESEPAQTSEQYVYTVSNNPSVFHAAETCDGQVNRRQITLDAALNEGLSPCEKCFSAG